MFLDSEKELNGKKLKNQKENDEKVWRFLLISQSAKEISNFPLQKVFQASIFGRNSILLVFGMELPFSAHLRNNVCVASFLKQVGAFTDDPGIVDFPN